MDTKTLLDQVRRFEEQRPSLPGEHWLTLGAGLVLLLSGGRGSVLGRTLSLAVGGALVYRAVQGRDGLGELLRREDAPGRRAVKVNGTVVASAAEPPEEPDDDIDAAVAPRSASPATLPTAATSDTGADTRSWQTP
jgi:hypothetical protein